VKNKLSVLNTVSQQHCQSQQHAQAAADTQAQALLLLQTQISTLTRERVETQTMTANLRNKLQTLLRQIGLKNSQKVEYGQQRKQREQQEEMMQQQLTKRTTKEADVKGVQQVVTSFEI
jgi:hypothetical protein